MIEGHQPRVRAFEFRPSLKHVFQGILEPPDHNQGFEAQVSDVQVQGRLMLYKIPQQVSLGGSGGGGPRE